MRLALPLSLLLLINCKNVPQPTTEISFDCNECSNPLKLEGRYQGKNLYAQNPMNDEANCYCACKVIVNEKIIMDSTNLQFSAFEIDLSACQIPVDSPVVVEIYQRPNCRVKVLNPVVH